MFYNDDYLKKRRQYSQCATRQIMSEIWRVPVDLVDHYVLKGMRPLIVLLKRMERVKSVEFKGLTDVTATTLKHNHPITRQLSIK